MLEKNGHGVLQLGGARGALRAGAQQRAAVPCKEPMLPRGGPCQSSHSIPPPWNFTDQEGVSGLQRGCCCVQHVLLREVLPGGLGCKEGR